MSVPDRDQRTLPPTPKRIADFKKRGDVALSRDTTMVITVAGGVLAMYAATQPIRSELSGIFTTIFRGLDHLEPVEGLALAGRAIAFASLPVCAGALVGFLLAMVLQLGAPPTFKKISFDITKSFSGQGWMRLFNLKSIAGSALQATAKITFVGGAAALALIAEHERFMSAPVLDASGIGLRIIAVCLRVFVYSGVAIGLVAAVELIRARRDLAARMRMTPQEMKRDMREQEGDPHIKRSRRQRMRELSKKRFNAAVKGADVVIVNPTEYAVALRYRAGKDRAPRVVAKGRGVIAERIRELARNNGIPILAQPPLARLLYRVVKEGREIPPDNYQAVALVLAYVHRLKKRGS